jgi:rhodanese-related sulfurtransferase
MLKINRNLMVILSILLVVGVVLAGGCATSGTETSTQIIENVTPQEAFTLIQGNQNNPDFFIIDVRTPEEFADGYVEDAILIDYYSDTFRDELNNLDKSKEYLIYCRSGNRSGRTLPIMEELGFQEVHDISGGILAWQAEGLPLIE